MGIKHYLVALPLIGAACAASPGCGVSGYTKLSKLPYYSLRSTSVGTAAKCSAHCTGDSKCKSFASGNGWCFHFGYTLSDEIQPDGRSPYKFYDRACSVPAGGPSSTAATSVPITGSVPTNAPTSTNCDVSVCAAPVTDPVIATTDSPPLPSSNVVFPSGSDVKAFTQTYTFEDYPLPSIVAMGSPPLASGLPRPTDAPTPPCLMDPTSTMNQFNLLGSNFIPLNVTNNQLKPMQTPTSEAQVKALGPFQNLVFAPFYFQQPAGAPAGVYDIVLAQSPPKYIARTQQGQVVLTTSSTGTSYVRRNGVQMVTTIFGLDCKGRISVTIGSQKYTWDVSGTSTTMTAGVASSNKTMLIAPLDKRSPQRLARRNKYTEGYAPRCPNSPPNLVAKVFPGARGLNPNGCGPANGIDYVPDFNFGKCCDAHDNCFDNCEGGTFAGCNSDFYGCMLGVCTAFDHWYDYLTFGACTFAASFYYGAVSTPIGRNAFNSANDDRCGCYCDPTQGLCGRGDKEYKCINMFGSDVENCGACGRKCSTFAKCNKGSCGCPHDQCGDRCVDLQTHPHHCGSCSNNCGDGQVCYQGQCWTPPPDKCVPGDGFPSGVGDFKGRGTGWTVCNKFQCTYDYDTPGEDHLVLNTGGDKKGDFVTTLKLCPGTKYDFSYRLQNNWNAAGCTVEFSFGNRGSTGKTEFPSSYETRGFVVDGFANGQDGASLNSDGLSISVPFSGLIICPKSGAMVAIRDLQMVPHSD